MFTRAKKAWAELRAGDVGSRFQAVYRRKHQNRDARLGALGFLRIILGSLIVLISPLVGVIPGPGGIFVFGFGLALIATENRRIARALDWLEVRGWRLMKNLLDLWRGAPFLGKSALSFAGICLLSAAAYAAWWIWFGS